MSDQVPPHIQRVVAEHAELSDRKGKLDAFFGTDLFCSLDEEEQADMKRQSELMAEYAEVLDRRICRAGFETEASTLDSGGGGNTNPPQPGGPSRPK